MTVIEWRHAATINLSPGEAGDGHYIGRRLWRGTERDFWRRNGDEMSSRLEFGQRHCFMAVIGNDSLLAKMHRQREVILYI